MLVGNYDKEKYDAQMKLKTWKVAFELSAHCLHVLFHVEERKAMLKITCREAYCQTWLPSRFYFSVLLL